MLAGGNPYDPSQMLLVEQLCNPGQESAFMMWVPPWALLFIIPFISLDFWIGKVFFQFSLVLAAIGGVRALFQSSSGSAAALILTLAFYPLWAPAEFGQIAGLLFIGLTLVVVGTEKDRPWLEGAGLVLLTIKPHVGYLVFVWYLRCWASGKRLSTLSRFSAVFTGVAGITWMIFPQSMEGWIAGFLHPPEGVPFAATWREASLSAYFADFLQQRFGLAQQFAAVALAFVLSAAAFLLFMLRPQAALTRRDLSIFLLVSAMTAPQSWVFDWCVLALVHLEMIQRAERMQRGRYALLAGIAALQIVLIWQRFFMIEYHHELVWFPPTMLFAYLGLVVIAGRSSIPT